MKRRGNPQQRTLNKTAKRKSMLAKLKSTIDPYQRKVFFSGAEREAGWIPMGNGYVRRTNP